MEELYMNFLQDQLKIINECEIDINKYHNLNKDNFDTIEDLKTIKNKALEKIQKAQNNFKDNVGIFPMDINYNKRVTNLMDMMLEKKINEIQRQNKLEMLANNYNKQKQMLRNNDISKNNGGYSYANENMNAKVNYNELSPISENEINSKNIMDCCYKSKYEELKKSMINGDEASQELRTSISLAGFSKFVMQNKLVVQNQDTNDNSNNGSNYNSNPDNMFCNINNAQSNLYTTWNEEKFEDDEQNDNNNHTQLSNNSLKNIDNNIDTSNINNNKNNNTLPKVNNKENNKKPTNKKTNNDNNLIANQFNKKLNNNRNTSKGILNDSQLPSRIIGNDKGLFNHANDDMSGSNISMQDSNSNINYINGSDLNIDPSLIKQNSPIMKKKTNSDTNNIMMNNDISPIGKAPVSKLNKNLQNKVKNLKISKDEKDKSLLLAGDNVIKNNLTHKGYSQREKENKEKSYLIGNITTNNNYDNTLINNTNNFNTPDNTFLNMNNDKNNNKNNITGVIDDRLGDNIFNNKESQDFTNENYENNENMSIGVTIGSKRNGLDNNETEEDIVRGFGPSGMNSMLNDENNSNFNHSNINNNSGISIVNHTFGKKKGLVNNNKEIQQIKEAEEKEEEENYCDFTLDNKTLKKLEEEEKSKNFQKINLEEYKEIKESQKIQTQLNFFEDSVIDNINVGKSKGRVVKSYNKFGNKNINSNNNASNNGTNNNANNNNNNINNSNSKKSNNTNNTNNKRPQSPKHNRNNNNNNKNSNTKSNNTNEENDNSNSNSNKKNQMINNNENSLFTNIENDSYGDNIIKDLDKYRKMFLEESSVSSINK